MFADRVLGAEKPKHVPHQREQIANLLIRAPFQTLPQFCPNPKCFKSFNQIVRSSQLPLVLEEFLNG
jgi:hypothetical protein